MPEFVQAQGWKAGNRKSAGSPVCQSIAEDQLLFPESIQLRGRCLLRVECSSMPGIECSVCRESSAQPVGRLRAAVRGGFGGGIWVEPEFQVFVAAEIFLTVGPLRSNSPNEQIALSLSIDVSRDTK